MYVVDDSDLEDCLGPRHAKCLPPLELSWIAPIRTQVSWEGSFELIKRYSRDSPCGSLGYQAGQAFQTTPEVFDHFLEAVPPLCMASGSFACGEMTTERLVDSYHKAEGRTFCVTVEWQGRDTLHQAWAAIMKSLVEAR